MGRFANGTQGDIYQARYCAGCIHDTDEECAVWFVHQIHGADEAKQEVLDDLIPRAGSGRNLQCAMFVEAGGEDS